MLRLWLLGDFDGTHRYFCRQGAGLPARDKGGKKHQYPYTPKFDRVRFVKRRSKSAGC